MKLFISSLLSSLMTFSYLYLPNHKGKIQTPAYIVAFFVALAYYIANYISYRTKRYLLVGSVLGLILSLIGRFILHLPRDLFKMENENVVHLVAPILYGLYFNFVVKYLNNLLLE